MHDYSIDKHPKAKVFFSLAFIAITFAPWINDWITTSPINSVITFLNIRFAVPLAPIKAMPVFVFFLGIYWLFENHFWKIPALRKIMLVPDLNGKWDCSGTTVVKGANATDHKWKGEITITQSWSKILISMRAAGSDSLSISASIFHVQGLGYRLLYQYQNRPKASSNDMQPHTGASELTFSSECNAAEGYYYTDQHRSTVGQIKLIRRK